MDRLSTMAMPKSGAPARGPSVPDVTGETSPDTGRRAVIHVDLDGASHIFRIHGWTWRGDQDVAYTTGVRHALDALDEAGVHATFFAIAEDLDDPRKAEMLREIVRRGHEIASHSLTHSLLTRLDAEGKRRELAGSRRKLEDGLGVEVSGFRAPWFAIDAQSLDIAADCGYTWDSSIRAGTTVPGLDPTITAASRPWRNGARGLFELPLPGHRPLPFPFHPSYSLILGFRYFSHGIARCERTGAPLVLLFHLIDFADPLPPALLRGWRQRIFTLSHTSGERKRAACRRMLERVRDTFAFTDTSGLLFEARHQYEEEAR